MVNTNNLLRGPSHDIYPTADGFQLYRCRRVANQGLVRPISHEGDLGGQSDLGQESEVNRRVMPHLKCDVD